MKRVFATLAILVGLAACEPAQQTANTGVFAGKTPQQIMPVVSGQTFLSVLAKVCERNLPSLKGAPRTIKAMGYQPIAVQGEVAMFAHPGGKLPVVGLAGPRPSSPEFCMVLMPDTKSIRRAVNSNVGGRKGAVEIPIKGLVPGALKSWVVGGSLFVTVTQRDPSFGAIYGVGVGPFN